MKLAEQFVLYHQDGLEAARVVAEHREQYKLHGEGGEFLASITGKLRHEATGRESFPAVGDWVVAQRSRGDIGLIHAVLPRKSKFSRNVAGETTEEQIIAANIDTVFLVTALNNNFNLRRIERALIMAWESNARPVIVLSKADLCLDTEAKVAEVERIAPGVPIHVISSLVGVGLDTLSHYLGVGETVALLGSSGVGKSTLTNVLMGEPVQTVHEVREDDDRGRHTTTHREILILPSGALLVDTPGFRELQLWDGDSGMSHTFADIDELAQNCQFSNCQHKEEPGCAVQQAIVEGRLPEDRLANYEKMKRELNYLTKKVERQNRQKSKGKKYQRQNRHRKTYE